MNSQIVNMRKPRQHTKDKVSKFLKKQKLPVTRAYINNKLMVDFKSVTAILNSLILEGLVEKLEMYNRNYFKWKE